jgi:hypothetical protein
MGIQSHCFFLQTNQYPRERDMKEAITFLQRTGCESIIGVGDSCSISFAKGIHSIALDTLRLPTKLAMIPSYLSGDTVLPSWTYLDAESHMLLHKPGSSPKVRTVTTIELNESLTSAYSGVSSTALTWNQHRYP